MCVRLFFEDKIYSEYQKDEPDEVIEPEGFVFEYCQWEYNKYNQCDDLLYYFEL